MAVKHALAAILLALAVGFACALFLFFPETLGLLCLGDSIFLALTLVLSPYASALVGGLGFGFADFLLGYPHYIIAAVTVKAFAGFAIGKISHSSMILSRRLSLLLCLGWLLCGGLFGWLLYSGEAYLCYPTSFFLGERVMEYGALKFQPLHVPGYFWAVLFAVTALLFTYLCLRFGRRYGLIGISMIAGALIVSVGHLLYEVFVLPLFGIKVDATYNFITNFGQTITESMITVLLLEIARICKTLVSKFEKVVPTKKVL